MNKVDNNFILALREKTGVGLLECKNAALYSNGDMDLAIAYLKAKTLAVATPKLSFDERVQQFYQKDSTY